MLGEVSQSLEAEEIDFLEVGSKIMVAGVGKDGSGAGTGLSKRYQDAVNLRGVRLVFCDEVEDCCSLWREVDIETQARVGTWNAISHTKP